MAVNMVKQSIDAEMIIDMRECKSFSEMKSEMHRTLNSLDIQSLGTLINVDTGGRSLTERQLRELEDILLEHGLHLERIVSNNTNDKRKRPEMKKIPGTMEVNQSISNIPEYDKTILICRNLRSGQKFFARENIVIFGDVNPGAEVIAGGNILVIGALRGMAHAGAYGDENTVITAYRLNPIQIRIANHITRPPDGEKIEVDTPELAYIRAGKVVIERLKI